MKDAVGFKEAFLVDGKPPEAGARLKQSKFADTLEHLAQAGFDDFYRGDVGREIAADLDRIGSPVTRADLEKFEATVAEPLGVRVQAGTLYNSPPPTQGLASLIILGAVRSPARGRRPRVSSTSMAWSRRPSAPSVCATASSPIPTRSPPTSSQFLSPAFLDAEAAKIDMKKAAPWPAPTSARATPSGWARRRHRPRRLLHPVALLGIRLRLRAAGDRHPDAEPRRELFARSQGAQRARARPPAVPHPQSGAGRAEGRPRHCVWDDGRRRPAADASAVFTRHVAFRQPLDKALDAPRWLLGRTWGSLHTNLRLEARFDGNLIDRLMAAGHDVEVLSEPYSDTMGHAGAVVLHPDGTLEGGHDPRADSGAAGV